jgi:hypothetical protein
MTILSPLNYLLFPHLLISHLSIYLPYVRNHCLALDRILVSKMPLIPRMMNHTTGNEVGHGKDNKGDCGRAGIRRDGKPHPLHNFSPIMRSRHPDSIEPTADWDLISSRLLAQSRQVSVDLPVDARAVEKEHDAQQKLRRVPVVRRIGLKLTEGLSL